MQADRRPVRQPVTVGEHADPAQRCGFAETLLRLSALNAGHEVNEIHVPEVRRNV